MKILTRRDFTNVVGSGAAAWSLLRTGRTGGGPLPVPAGGGRLRYTSDLANIYGIRDRGTLAVGNWADLILFDPQEIRITKTERIHDLPADGARLVRSAPGLLGTWVNGVCVFDGTDYADVTPPGHILRKFEGGRPRVGMPENR